jgi:hypothetical protein
MTYLNLVVKEGTLCTVFTNSHAISLLIFPVLRLYPSVPVNSRAALKTTTLPTGGGADGKSPILVRKGEAVGYCVYAMHRRKDLYGLDAHLFRPERWEGDELKDIGWGYLPFNGGPRICLGRKFDFTVISCWFLIFSNYILTTFVYVEEFALLEASYTIARIIQSFPMIDVPNTEPEVDVGQEKQILTLVVSSGEGCIVRLKDSD